MVEAVQALFVRNYIIAVVDMLAVEDTLAVVDMLAVVAHILELAGDNLAEVVGILV